MAKKEYLPLGSIVLLKGGVQKIIIISRAITIKNKDKLLFFDYGAALYPDGLIGEKMVFFNAGDISKVVFEGYADIDNENVVDNINSFLDANDVEYGSPEKWSEEE